MLLLFAAAITIPLGLDLYLPVPEENPITMEKIALGRRLFYDRRLSRDRSISCVRVTIRSAHSAMAVRSRLECSDATDGAIRRLLLTEAMGDCSSGMGVWPRWKSRC